MPSKYLVALKKPRVTNVEKVGKFKSGCVSVILKIQISGHFLSLSLLKKCRFKKNY